MSWSSQLKFIERFCSKWERSYTEWKVYCPFFVSTFISYLIFLAFLVCLCPLAFYYCPLPFLPNNWPVWSFKEKLKAAGRWLIHSLLCANWPGIVGMMIAPIYCLVEWIGNLLCFPFWRHWFIHNFSTFVFTEHGTIVFFVISTFWLVEGQRD